MGISEYEDLDGLGRTEVVKWFKRAGLIVAGKTNTPERRGRTHIPGVDCRPSLLTARV